MDNNKNHLVIKHDIVNSLQLYFAGATHHPLQLLVIKAVKSLFSKSSQINMLLTRIRVQKIRGNISFLERSIYIFSSKEKQHFHQNHIITSGRVNLNIKSSK